MSAVGQRGGRKLAVLVLAALVAIVGVVVAVRVVIDDRPAPAKFVLGAEDLTFSTDTITVRAGTVEITLANTDAIAHTFSVPQLGIDLEAGGGEARSILFDASPGRYPFKCTIPGHEGPGMRGTLNVVK